MQRITNLLLLLFLSLGLFAQDREKVRFEKENYWGWYNEVLEQPIYIEYTIKNCDYGHSRKGLNFYKEKDIHTSDDADYYKNPWDKGHLVPAASQNCTKEMIKETFSYLNCTLQWHSLNQGVWKQLEEWERELAFKFNVRVRVVPLFNEKSQKLKTGATIPTGFHKTILLDDGFIIYKFYFPNKQPIHKSFKRYIIYK